MRISDWSSDVCSSDLCRAAAAASPRSSADASDLAQGGARACESLYRHRDRPARLWRQRKTAWRCGARELFEARDGGRSRSEEHTSELQSLMRTSYAVFCLKKQKNCEQITY